MGGANNTTGSRARGTLAGLSEGEATSLLVLLARMARGGPGSMRRPSQQTDRTKVQRAWLLEELEETDTMRGFPRTTPEQREALVAAFVKLPGVTYWKEKGVYQVPRDIVAVAMHRNWRYASGQLNYADAQALQKALANTKHKDLTPRLIRLSEKLEQALAELVER